MSASGSPAPIILSPFANERVREWPLAHFRRLIELILRHDRLPVLVVGTRAQRVRANALVRGFSASSVTNACGTMSWDEVRSAVGAAPYVVANNSGIAHLAAALGRWTLCLFASSHADIEWMARGPRAIIISLALPCAPCDIGGNPCPNGVACMAELKPDEAYSRFCDIRARLAGPTAGAAP